MNFSSKSYIGGERRKSKAGDGSRISDGGSGEIDIGSRILVSDFGVHRSSVDPIFLHYLVSPTNRYFSSTYRKMRLFFFCKLFHGRVRRSFLLFSCDVPREQQRFGIVSFRKCVQLHTSGDAWEHQ